MLQSTLSTGSSSDVQVVPGPTDCVSEIASCPTADFFAASSWDNQVTISKVVYSLYLIYLHAFHR